MYTIDRFVAIIKPKQPFLDWLESLPDWDLDITVEDLRQDSNAYLVPEYDSTDQAMRYIERKHRSIFEWEFWSWYTDETVWPEKLTLSVFRKWFDVEIYEMVIDLLDTHIMREEL